MLVPVLVAAVVRLGTAEGVTESFSSEVCRAVALTSGADLEAKDTCNEACVREAEASGAEVFLVRIFGGVSKARIIIERRTALIADRVELDVPLRLDVLDHRIRAGMRPLLAQEVRGPALMVSPPVQAAPLRRPTPWASYALLGLGVAAGGAGLACALGASRVRTSLGAGAVSGDVYEAKSFESTALAVGGLIGITSALISFGVAVALELADES